MTERPAYVFTAPLTEGLILKRKSQFTMSVKVNNEKMDCHCPTTGRIGNIEVSGRPCLLSRSSDPTRKTPYTVEAISLDRPEDAARSWIGINQNAVNRYVEHYLSNGGFSNMIVTDGDVKREQSLGMSKLDLLVGDTYIEVKMPLVSLQLDIPEHVRTKKSAPFSSTDRFVKHITDLANSLQEHQRAILLTCFIYDNPGFKVTERSTNHDQVRAAVDKVAKAGVELWQVNFNISQYGVELVKYFRFQTDQI